MTPPTRRYKADPGLHNRGLMMTFRNRLIVIAGCYLLGLCPVMAGAVTVVDVAGPSGFPTPTPSNGESVVLDYDADGDADILLNSHGQEWPLLSQGPAGKFTKVLPGTFATRQDRHGCATADFNGDGRPDV
jgi:hypothetical protein